MNRLIRSFLQGLHDRIIASLGSMIGSTFSAFRVAQHAQQMSELEDLARKYESEGKNELADQLRGQAATLNLDDPGTEARLVFRNVLEDRSLLPAPIEDSQVDTPKADGEPLRRVSAKSKRKGRKPAPPLDDMGISLD